jgi:mono/diheme cytochrome c family protein
VNKVLKWLGITAAFVVALVVICAAAVFAISARRIGRTWPPMDMRPVTIPHDSAALARGAHLAEAVTKCVYCHGEDLSGGMFIDDPAFGRIPAPNLTRGKGGRGMAYTDQDLVRLIRRGIKPDGRAAVIMPSDTYQFLGDADLGAIIGWVRSLPPVEHEWPAPVFGPVFRMLVAFGVPFFPADRIAQANLTIAPAPAPGPTAEYGRYLTQIGGCRFCHNPSYSGGKIVGVDPKSPPAANLTPAGIGGWTEADFVKVLRTGKRYGDNAPMNNAFMPWIQSGHMTDEEIHAVWLFLQTLPAKEYGQP